MTITIADGRGALWQWDTGRRVKITDGDGVKQVHYQNRCFGRSVDVDVGTDGTAIIPDELLQDWHPLTAYAYVIDDAGGYTKVQVDFAVHKRARPSDYVYPPTDQMTLQTIQRQIGDLDDLATGAKDTLVAAINEAARSGGGAGSMDLRVADGYIQYSTDGGSTWTNLIAVADLKGADGKPGAAGADGVTPHIGDNGNWYVGSTDTGKPSRGVTGAPGKDGADGKPGGKIIVEQEGISLRQIGSRQYDRSLVKGILRISETAQLDHFCTVLTELLRQLLRRLHIAELQHLCLDLDPSAEHLVEKALDEYRGILQNTGSRHERSLPLHSLEMPLLHEPQHGSTHCGTADAELVTELYFLGDHIAYRSFCSVCHSRSR